MATAIMVDCETMGVSTRAAIIEIGAVVFDTDTGATGMTFRRDIDLVSSILEGGDISLSTVNFWKSTGRVFRAARTPIELPTALREFSEWYREQQAYQVWACGMNADITWLESAYQTLGMEVPWRYNAPRDFRTMREVARSLGWTGYFELEVSHDALEDAMQQVEVLTDIFRFLRGPATEILPVSAPADVSVKMFDSAGRPQAEYVLRDAQVVSAGPSTP